MKIELNNPNTRQKKTIFFIWILVVIGGMMLYIIFPDKINLLFLKNLVKDHYLAVLIIYFLLLSFRGLTMVPSTPLLLAGIIIFNPVELFILNMLGIMVSSTLVYYFSRYIGFDLYFEIRYEKYVKKIRNGFKDHGIPIIVAWSFFPLVPTDLIIYVGSTLRVNIFKCLLGVFVGEAILNASYILSARMILQL
ncbi:TVP38/TMEM64 family protein [Methanosarcina siciliae]|uniref:TVP38/TMEM64 family protein n=2 Tax=Methanosarcina siciliae TaxID=38027 RepID=UPI00064F00A8|nr:VTT domain-containing protein [Methanosarcina siciliae]